MTGLVLPILERFGAFGVFFLILLENVFPPIPSEVLLTFSGFLTTRTALTLPVVIGAATAGSLAGALVLYGVGRLVDEARLCRFCRGGGRFLGLHEEDVHRTLARYAAGADRTVFFCRMVPILRSLISIPAGMARMPLGRFLVLTCAGSLCWNALLCSAGAALGDAWMLLLRYTDFYTALTLTVLAVAAAGLLLRAVRRRKAAGPLHGS